MPPTDTPPDGFTLDAEAQTAGGITAREDIPETDHPEVPADVSGNVDDDTAIDQDDGQLVDKDV